MNSSELHHLHSSHYLAVELTPYKWWCQGVPFGATAIQLGPGTIIAIVLQGLHEAEVSLLGHHHGDLGQQQDQRLTWVDVTKGFRPRRGYIQQLSG